MAAPPWHCGTSPATYTTSAPQASGNPGSLSHHAPHRGISPKSPTFEGLRRQKGFETPCTPLGAFPRFTRRVHPARVRGGSRQSPSPKAKNKGDAPAFAPWAACASARPRPSPPAARPLLDKPANKAAYHSESLEKVSSSLLTCPHLWNEDKHSNYIISSPCLSSCTCKVLKTASTEKKCSCYSRQCELPKYKNKCIYFISHYYYYHYYQHYLNIVNIFLYLNFCFISLCWFV